MRAEIVVSPLLLRNVPLFAMMAEDQLAILATAMHRKNFLRGEAVIPTGVVNDSLYVVISGRFEVIIGDRAGRKVILTALGPGEYFGEMALLDDNTGSASVIAMDSGELLVLSRYEFRKCLADNFGMALTMLRCSVQRLREADRKIGSLALMDVYGRVAEQLLFMSETIDGQHVITKKVVKQDIARVIGASREMVSRTMKDLEAKGVIEIRGSSIYLSNRIAQVD
ncbi:MAG: Crp/Fnr family transcriptional regulator [Proteobacteria bacterium]|nr:Crp/Fnr family transcriptional regulator [Pseudomonadota bacterium]